MTTDVRGGSQQQAGYIAPLKFTPSVDGRTPGGVGVGGFEALHAEYLAWVTATFPDEATEDQWQHLKEEFEELLSARNNASEYADVLMLLCCVARGHGINIFEAFAAKFAVNKARTWKKTERGFRHVAGGGGSENVESGAKQYNGESSDGSEPFAATNG